MQLSYKELLKLFWKCIPWLFRVLITILKNAFKTAPTLKKCTQSWQEEKSDIIERANWLCKKIIIDPEQLINEMPAILGPHFAGEWAIYSCSMLTAALSNISMLYPEEKPHNLERIEKIIDIILSPIIRKYDTESWGEDALETLDCNKSHMTYLSILAWTISNYKLVGGSDKYDTHFHKCCEALARRMLKNEDLNLPSFPFSPIYIPDMMVAIVALGNYAKFYDTKYADIVNQWIERAKSEWIHDATKLLKSILDSNQAKRIFVLTHDKYQDSTYIRGSYTALNCYYLTLVDPEFAKEQYINMKNNLMSNVKLLNIGVCGIREYLYHSPTLDFDVDAGPIVQGLSPSGSVFAIGSATYFKDWEFRAQLLRVAEIVGQTVKRKKQRHYLLGEIVLVGEAATLAMRTNIAR